LPLNVESAARIHIGEGADWSFLGFDLVIAPNAGQMASENQSDGRREQNDQVLSHVECVFLGYDATTSRFGFNKDVTEVTV
jgi:hypothetical protein